MRRTRMNTAPDYHLSFFGVASSRTGSRFDTVEVAGSSPVVPTSYLIESAQSRAAAHPSFDLICQRYRVQRLKFLDFASFSGTIARLP
jgi:hypothetical protein